MSYYLYDAKGYLSDGPSIRGWEDFLEWGVGLDPIEEMAATGTTDDLEGLVQALESHRATGSVEQTRLVMLKAALHAEDVLILSDGVGAEEPKTLGGPGSGNFGHEGRPGQVGGSGGGSSFLESSLHDRARAIDESDNNLSTDSMTLADGWNYRRATSQQLDKQLAQSIADSTNLSRGEVQDWLGAWRGGATVDKANWATWQRSINDEFDLTETATNHLSKRGQSNETVRQIARAQYDLTQEALKQHGVDSMTLYRAQASNDKALQPATSWTLSRDFAEKASRWTGGGQVYEARVPRERILMLPTTGGVLQQAEVVVLGGPLTVKGFKTLGGPGSGNFGHAGRPGEVGGSSSGVTITEQGEGWVELKSTAGGIHARVVDGVFTVRESYVRGSEQGKGEGRRLYEQALRYASQQGMPAQSSERVSVSADRVWASLERRGFPVQRNANVEFDEPAGKFYAVKDLPTPAGPVRIPSGEPLWTMQAGVALPVAPRTLARHPETALHTAADSFLDKALVAVNFAFAAARRAVDKQALETAIALPNRAARRRGILAAMRPAPEALGAALDRALRPTLERCYGAGGEAGLGILKRQIRTLGGPGSGNFGHAGRPGEVGGSSGDGPLLFHGTRGDNLDSILKDGLTSKRGVVYATSDFSVAKIYAENSSKHHVAILEIHVPSDPSEAEEVILQHRLDTAKSHYIDRAEKIPVSTATHFPASWIKAVHERESSKSAWRIRQLSEVTQTSILYVPVVLDDEPRTLRRTSPYDMKFNAKSKASIAWAKKHTGELITNVTKTTRRQIVRAVVKALDGGSPRQLYKDVLKAIGDPARADLIARSELMDAASSGQREAWAQAVEEGLLTGTEMREWIKTADEGTCDLCDNLDGKLAELDGDYPDGGGIGPPAHPRCRCTEGISPRRING